MELTAASILAVQLMNKHGLISNGWRFEFDGGKRRFGCCFYQRKIITLSKHIVSLNEEDKVHNTILHEIAHGLCTHADGHGWKWKSVAMSIGADPTPCFDDADVNTPQGNYIGKCLDCGKEFRAFRKGKRMNSKYHVTCIYKQHRGSIRWTYPNGVLVFPENSVKIGV